MEYLPEDLHRDVELKRKQKQDKLKNFRQYLVDKQIVLSLVKFLLALRSSDKRPENPIEYLQDYFGKYRDPQWDLIEKLNQENSKLQVREKELDSQMSANTIQLNHQILINRVYKLFSKFEKDKNGNIAIKTLYKALCGNPKFEVNTTLDKANFIRFMYFISIQTDELVDPLNPSDEQIKHTAELWEKISPDFIPYQTDLENEEFKKIAAKMKSYAVKAA